MGLLKQLLDRFAGRQGALTALVSPWQDGREAWPNERPDVNSMLRLVRGDVYACVQLLAASVAEGAQLKLFTTQPTTRTPTRPPDPRMRAHLKDHGPLLEDVEEAEEVLDHPLLDMFKQVNGLPWFGPFEFFETWSVYADTSRFFAFIAKDVMGTPRELWPLPPGPMKAILDRQGLIDHWEYEIGTEKVRFEVEEILYHRRASAAIDTLEQIYGFPPLRGVITAADASLTIMEYERALLKNRAVPDVVLKVSGANMREKRDRISEAWHSRFGGRHQGRVAVVGEDVEVMPLGFSPKDLQNVEAAKAMRELVCNAFGVPISMMTMESSNRAVADAGLVQMARFAIRPRLRRIAETINQTLIPMFDPERNLFVVFPDPVPEDRAQDVAENVAYVQNKILTINEVREGLGREPHEDGDELFREIDLESVMFGGAGGDDDDEPRQRSLRHKIRDNPGDKPKTPGLQTRLEAIFQRQAQDVLRQVKSAKALDDPVTNALFTELSFDLDRWNEVIMRETGELVDQQLRSGARQGISQLRSRGFGVAFDIEDFFASEYWQRQGADWVAKFAAAVNEFTKAKIELAIQAALDEGQTIKQLRDRIANIDGFAADSKRAERIARSETKRANQGGRKQSYVEAGVTRLEWAASSDPCPWCATFDGRIVGVEEVFAPQGGQVNADFPDGDGGTVTRTLNLNYSDIPHPPLHPNCQCVVLPVVE